MTDTTQAAGLTGLAHEIWALAQRAPGEGIEDCTARIETALGAALAARPARAAGLTKDQIRSIFMAHGFTIKDGQTDLKGYVYKAAEALIDAALAAQAVPDYERMRHIANEWADMAANGMQWLRNIKQGISTVEDAIENMQTNYAHCRKVNDATGRYGQDASPAPAEAKEEPPFLVRDVAELIGCTVPDIHIAAQAIGIRGLSTNMQIFPDEARAIAAHLKATPQPQAAQPVGEVFRARDGEWGFNPSKTAWGVPTKPLVSDASPYRFDVFAAAPALTEEQEREAFEEWAESEDFDLSVSWGNQQYTDDATLLAWEAWQGRAALRSTQGGE